MGRGGVNRLLAVIDDEADDRVPVYARLCLQMVVCQLKLVKPQIMGNDRRVLATARSIELGRRLMEEPGIGPLVALALVAATRSIGPPLRRNMSAWLGAKHNSSGGQERPGLIGEPSTAENPMPMK